jgi:two-component system LytT family response regulator
MIKAIIIDDDANLRIGLKTMLARYAPQIQVVAEADSVESGVFVIQNNPSDVLFLDIQMGDGTGFDILETLKRKNKIINQQIVFITAFEQYAIKAFRFSALDYLLKPVDPEELTQVTNKIYESVKNQTKTDHVDVLLDSIRNKNEDLHRIVLNNSEGMHILEIEDIIRCESEDNYTKFYLKSAKPLMISKTLKEYEELLSDEGFLRIHQSHLINLKYVDTFNKSDSKVKMSDSSFVPVSQRKKEKFLEVLKTYK